MIVIQSAMVVNPLSCLMVNIPMEYSTWWSKFMLLGRDLVVHQQSTSTMQLFNPHFQKVIMYYKNLVNPKQNTW